MHPLRFLKENKMFKLNGPKIGKLDGPEIDRSGSAITEDVNENETKRCPVRIKIRRGNVPQSLNDQNIPSADPTPFSTSFNVPDQFEQYSLSLNQDSQYNQMLLSFKLNTWILLKMSPTSNNSNNLRIIT